MNHAPRIAETRENRGQADPCPRFRNPCASLRGSSLPGKDIRRPRRGINLRRSSGAAPSIGRPTLERERTVQAMEPGQRWNSVS
jgi:hypothetical protein